MEKNEFAVRRATSGGAVFFPRSLAGEASDVESLRAREKSEKSRCRQIFSLFFFCSSFVFASLVFTQALANTRSKLRASLAFSHTMSLNKRVGFIGAGQMAEALARGFVARGVVTVSAITATDPVAARKEVFKSFGASVTGSNAEVRLRWLLLAI